MKTDVHAEFRALRAARDRGEPLDSYWATFRAKVVGGSGEPPHLVAELLRQIRVEQGSRRPEDLRLLDHGCGGGFIILYLTALGYTGTFGVDVGDPNRPDWNDLLRGEVGDEQARVHTYGGDSLPFPDEWFDVIFSTQVIDHVESKAWQSYFSEEARVLKPGGRVFHEAPHRLAPYDSHTRTWFLHYLPRPIYLVAYRISKRGGPSTHHLRFPGAIVAALRQNIGPVENHAIGAFMGTASDAYFDGPKGLRRAVLRAARFPILGGLVRWGIGPFLMLRASATKNL